MEIILATQNNGKIKEFNELAKGTDLNFIPIPSNTTAPQYVTPAVKCQPSFCWKTRITVTRLLYV